MGAGPATVAKLGKGSSWQATWTSFLENEAGYLIAWVKGLGTGTTWREIYKMRSCFTTLGLDKRGHTSEQSMSLRGSWPRTCSLAIAALNWDIMSCWLSIYWEWINIPQSRYNVKYRYLTNHFLPEARGPGVLRDDEVTLETHLSSEWGQDFTWLRAVVRAREKSTLQEDFEEDLRVAV